MSSSERFILVVFVLKYAQAAHLLHEKIRLRVRVTLHGADEDNKALADFAGLAAVYGDLCTVYTLNNCSHIVNSFPVGGF